MDGNIMVTVAYIAFFFALMYFLLIRPQNKKNKKQTEMRNSVVKGDEIVTIGGITGKVVMVREEDLVMAVGADKTKITIKKWAISTIEKEEIRDEVVGEIEEETK